MKNWLDEKYGLPFENEKDPTFGDSELNSNRESDRRGG